MKKLNYGRLFWEVQAMPQRYPEESDLEIAKRILKQYPETNLLNLKILEEKTRLVKDVTLWFVSLITSLVLVLKIFSDFLSEKLPLLLVSMSFLGMAIFFVLAMSLNRLKFIQRGIFFRIYKVIFYITEIIVGLGMIYLSVKTFFRIGIQLEYLFSAVFLILWLLYLMNVYFDQINMINLLKTNLSIQLRQNKKSKKARRTTSLSRCRTKRIHGGIK